MKKIHLDNQKKTKQLSFSIPEHIFKAFSRQQCVTSAAQPYGAVLASLSQGLDCQQEKGR